MPKNLQQHIGLVFPPRPTRRFEWLRELSDNEYREYVEAQSSLSRFFIQHPYVLTRRTYREFTRTYDDYRSRFNHSVETGGTPMVEGNVLFDINSRLAMWLESFHLFLCQTETDLTRRHGKPSPQWDTWVSAKSHQFDEKFAYRFMYGLRNSLHVSTPATHISLSAGDSSGVITSDFQITFSRDRLLACGREWHKNVLVDLQAKPERFALMPIAQELCRAIDELMLTVINLEIVDMMPAAKVISTLALEAWAEPGTAELGAQPVILSEVSNNPGSEETSFSVQQLPMHLLPLVEKAMAGEMTIFSPEEEDGDTS